MTDTAIGNEQKLLIITGTQESGKTSLCKAGIAWCSNNGIPQTGVICPGIYKNNLRICITAYNVQTGYSCLLGIRNDMPDIQEQLHALGIKVTSPFTAPFIETPRWRFSLQAFAQCSSWLRTEPCSVFWIDELGILEFKDQQGFYKAFEILNTQHYKLAITVIRPELIDCLPDFVRGVTWNILDVTATEHAYEALVQFIAQQYPLHR